MGLLPLITSPRASCSWRYRCSSVSVRVLLCCAIACLAYNSIVGEANCNGALTFDNVSKSFMLMALSLFFCLGVCVAVLFVALTFDNVSKSFMFMAL